MFRTAITFLLLLFMCHELRAQSRRAPDYSESDSRETGKSKISESQLNSNPNFAPNSANNIKNSDDEEVIRVNTDLVLVHARVSDGGKHLAGLKAREFKIFENEIEQPIAYFSDADEPFTVALVLDMSYSSVFKLKEIQAAALVFVDQLRAGDKVMIVSFDEEVRVLCQPTSDRKVLRYAVEDTKIRSGSSFFQALDVVLNQKFKNVQGRKAIVVMSDGVDTTSRASNASEILRAARESDVIVYPLQYDTYQDVQKNRKESADVIYDDYDRPILVPRPEVKGERKNDYAEAKRFFDELAGATNGRVYKVSSSTNLTAAFYQIADELRKIYSLGYYANDEPKVGTERRLKIRVYRPRLTIKTRKSFVRQ